MWKRGAAPRSAPLTDWERKHEFVIPKEEPEVELKSCRLSTYVWVGVIRFFMVEYKRDQEIEMDRDPDGKPDFIGLCFT